MSDPVSMGCMGDCDDEVSVVDYDHLPAMPWWCPECHDREVRVASENAVEDAIERGLWKQRAEEDGWVPSETWEGIQDKSEAATQRLDELLLSVGPLIDLLEGHLLKLDPSGTDERYLRLQIAKERVEAALRE